MALLMSIGGGSLHDDIDTDVSVLLPPETKGLLRCLTAPAERVQWPHRRGDRRAIVPGRCLNQMMNTRSLACTQAAKAASSSAPTPRDDRMGIRLAGEIRNARLKMLVNWEIRNTKWAYPTILNQLSMTLNYFATELACLHLFFRVFLPTAVSLSVC